MLQNLCKNVLKVHPFPLPLLQCGALRSFSLKGSQKGHGQAIKKEKFDKFKAVKMSDTILMNEMITFPELRVVFTSDVTKEKEWKIMSRAEALALANKMGLDLVLGSASASPPVAKIERLADAVVAKEVKDMKAKEDEHARKKLQTVKEVYMACSIEKHDFSTKMKHIEKFLENGNRVKVAILPRIFTRAQAFNPDGSRRSRMEGFDELVMNFMKGIEPMKVVVDEVKVKSAPTAKEMEQREKVIRAARAKAKEERALRDKSGKHKSSGGDDDGGLGEDEEGGGGGGHDHDVDSNVTTFSKTKVFVPLADETEELVDGVEIRSVQRREFILTPIRRTDSVQGAIKIKSKDDKGNKKKREVEEVPEGKPTFKAKFIKGQKPPPESGDELDEVR